jgi:hypothetical protein
MQRQNPILNLRTGLLNPINLQLNSRLLSAGILLNSGSAHSIQGGGVLILRVEGVGG